MTLADNFQDASHRLLPKGDLIHLPLNFKVPQWAYGPKLLNEILDGVFFGQSDKVRMLFSEGVSRHELDKLLPVSAYSIDKWTKGIKKKSSKKIRKNNFSRVKITHDKDCISKNAISTNITIYHSRGFYIEIKDVNIFDFILQTIMGLSKYK